MGKMKIPKVIRHLIVWKKRRDRKSLDCPWCGGKIRPGSEITCYSLFHSSKRDDFTMMGKVRIISRDPTTFVGCTSLTCPSNYENVDGVIVGGFYHKNGRIEIKKSILEKEDPKKILFYKES